MLPAPPFQLPETLERATARMRRAAARAAAQAVDSLGLAALAAPQRRQRDELLAARQALALPGGRFGAAFDEALDQAVARAAGLLTPTERPVATPEQLVASWDALSLVDDTELEFHISADRLALSLAQACEWEWRELDAYIAPLLGLDSADQARNPLRTELLAQALLRGIEAVSDQPAERRLLADHLGRALAPSLREACAGIVAELRAAGARPAGLTVRPTPPRADAGAPVPAPVPAPALPPRPTSGPAHTSGPAAPVPMPAPAADTPLDPALGRVPTDLMGLLRRLASAPWPASSGPVHASDPAPPGAFGDVAPPAAQTAPAPDPSAPPLPNLIQTHRRALQQAAGTALDHRMIDLVASLFGQILSDRQLPPAYVRQIARLQLPVLRAALGDARFFTARDHPVRRFVNRIASLGLAGGSPDSAAASALLAEVDDAVRAVLTGAFDRSLVYERQLARLEGFVAAQARAEADSLGDARGLLARKEAELLRQRQFAATLGQALAELPLPDYLRDFLAGPWAAAIARAEHKEGARSPLSRHLRSIGSELVMSVQPKGSPVQRQQFLQRLPHLMKDLHLGLDHARCPAEARRAFFARLLPDHAQALKRPPLSTLDHNLLQRRVDAALALPLPLDRHGAEPRPAAHAAAPADDVATATTTATTVADPSLQAVADDQVFSPAEARQLGLLTEQAVDWQTMPVDIDLGPGGEVPLQAVDIALDGLPPPDAPEPTRGAALFEHLQPGLCYQMQLEGRWQPVRLAHVSASRSFFVFTHGHRQLRTVSMTCRMLRRLCEGGRLRALEAAYLLERATARVRRELAALKPAS